MATTTPFLNWSNTNCQMCVAVVGHVHFPNETTFTLCCRSNSAFQKSVLLENCLLLYWTMPETCNVSKNERAGSQAKLDLTIFWWFFPSKSLNHPLLGLFRKKLCALKEFLGTFQLKYAYYYFASQYANILCTFCIFVVMELLCW